jgi:hypothetical protein
VRKRTIVTVAAAFAAVAAAMPADAVSAKAPTVSDPIAQGLAGPLQMSVNKHGIAVGQSFALTVSKIGSDGSVENLVTEKGNPDKGADVAGVLLTGKGVVYTYTNAARGVGKLKFVSNEGETSTIANLARFESKANPDRHNKYGFTDLSRSCKAQLPEDSPGGDPYAGVVESHPYAIAKAPGGYYVADAAGNDIVWVSRAGDVKTVAVLKPQGTRITKGDAAGNGLPECTIGARYRGEPVPTDVEVLRNGKLVVSLLPGAPEGRPRGKVVGVDPGTGRSDLIAKGFLGATNVAVGRGSLFVTNLMGPGSVSKVGSGGTENYVDLPSPAALEWYQGKLYVGYDVFGPSGKIATIG